MIQSLHFTLFHGSTVEIFVQRGDMLTFTISKHHIGCYVGNPLGVVVVAEDEDDSRSRKTSWEVSRTLGEGLQWLKPK